MVIVYCASMVTFRPFTELGERCVLEALAKTRPEKRHEALKRLCEKNGIRLRFVEDLETGYKDDVGEKVLLIEV